MNATTEHLCGTMGTHKQVCRACVNTPALIATYEEVPMAVDPTPFALVASLPNQEQTRGAVTR